MEEGVQVVLDSEFGVVVVAWDDDTHGQLFGVIGEVPNFIDTVIFLGFDSLLLLVSVCVDFVVEGRQKYALQILLGVKVLHSLLMELLPCLDGGLIIENIFDSVLHKNYPLLSLFL